MITIEINGKSQQVAEGTTVSRLLLDLKINNKYCAVERNLELIPREQHADCELSNGDRIEIVTLVGGG